MGEAHGAFSCTVLLVDQPDPIRERVKMLHDHKNDLTSTTLHTSTDECWCAEKMTQNNCGACGLFIDEKEQDAQGFHLAEFCDANDEIEIRSMFIECREWFDKTYGNSYFSARVWINGKIEIVLPFQYGYERHFETVAVHALVEKGFISEQYKNRALWVIANEMGFDCYTSKANTTKKEMFKESN